MKKLIAKQNYRCDKCGQLIKKGHLYLKVDKDLPAEYWPHPFMHYHNNTIRRLCAECGHILIKKVCISCGKAFETSSYGQAYCELCRVKNKKNESLQEIIQEIRKDFLYLLRNNPEKAYSILNEMIVVEGHEFVKEIFGKIMEVNDES